MVDIKEFLDIESKKEQYLYKIKKLEAKKQHVIRQLSVLQDECHHNYVLYLSEENAPITPDAYAVCVCCGKNFFFSELTPESIDELNQKNLISIRSYLEANLGRELDLESISAKSLIKRAHEKIVSIAALDPSISEFDLKAEIKNDLLAFMLEQESLKRIRK